MFQECKFIVNCGEIKASLRYSVISEEDTEAIINSALWLTCIGEFIDPCVVECDAVVASIKTRSVYETIRGQLSPVLKNLSKSLPDDYVFDLDFAWEGDIAIISIGGKEDELSGIP